MHPERGPVKIHIFYTPPLSMLLDADGNPDIVTQTDFYTDFRVDQEWGSGIIYGIAFPRTGNIDMPSQP